MKKYLNLLFKILVGSASVVVLFTACLLVYVKIDEMMIVKVENPSIELLSVNHWVSGNKLIFSAIAKNKSDIEWRNVSFNFIVSDSNGVFLDRCFTTHLNKPFQLGAIDIKAVCRGMPAGLKDYSYRVKMHGEH